MTATIQHCHSFECGDDFGGNKTSVKVLQSKFYWPTLFKDANSFVKAFDKCQRTRNISRKNEMPLNSILAVELFDVLGIDFPLPPSFENKYILLAVDYVSKWVEVIPTITCDGKVVLKFLRKCWVNNQS